MKLYITTLGNFDIRDENQSLFKETSRQYRLYKLLQYFITFRHKKLLPENIIENIFSDNDSLDPKNVLRSQIFRLRQLLDEYIPKDENESNYINISFANGYYTLEIGEMVVLDMDYFETLIKEADRYETIDINKSTILYKEALSLYNGAYLSEQTYETWIVPTRNYYYRMYIKTLYKLIEILKSHSMYEEIVEICEKALMIEHYDENIHISLVEAMLNLGHIKIAMNHYIYTTSLLEKEFHTKPSPRLQELFLRMRNYAIE